MEWSQLKSRLDSLLESDKKSELRGALRMLNRVDVAEYLSELDTDKMLRVFRMLPTDISSEVFSYMDDEQQEKLITSIGDSEVRALVDDMFIDDAVDFLEEMPDALVKRVLSTVSPDTRKLINTFLSYPENSAGSIMTVEYCAFPMSFTVARAMQEIRSTGLDKEIVNTLYVVDEEGRLKGSLSLSRLIMAADDVPVAALTDAGRVCVTTNDDQELVAETVRKYHLLAVPVTDKEGRLVGIVTADDVMDVMQDEATEDIEKMSALTPSEDTYIKSGVLTLVKNRLPWLMIMLTASILTGLIINHYNGLITGFEGAGIALAACIPMIMDTCGNCGQQASTLVVRGLATGELSPSDVFTVLWKETRVSLTVAAVLAFFCFLIQHFLFGAALNMSLVISAAMVCAVIFAKIIGGLLPLAAKAVKLDPALTAVPLITTISDTGSLLILFALASAILK